MVQSREHKTDHSVTAHFPAHYQQQDLMGPDNERPCLGQVTGEHSPNSMHPSFFLSFPFFLRSRNLQTFPTTVNPPRAVIVSVLLFLSSSCLPSPLPIGLLLPLLTYCICLCYFSAALTYPPFFYITGTPHASPGGNLDNLDKRRHTHSAILRCVLSFVFDQCYSRSLSVACECSF